MPSIKIKFLGTGTSQGVPIIGLKDPVCMSKNPKDKRMRASILIQWDGYNFVVDCGPDFRQQILNAGVQRLDGILFTHEHADHTAGLDDIRPFSNIYGALPIYAHKRVIDNLKKRFFYIFDKNYNYPGAPKVAVREICETPFIIGNKTITPIRVTHGKLPIFGYRIENFAYITDAKYIDESELKKLKNLDVLVVNTLRITPHETHFNLDEALRFIEKVQPKQTYLTHISHLLGLHNEVEKKLPNHIKPAYDTLEVQC
ncbi:phosphoribosyl 1,2-cyclic phosphate phosphodiesterase [Elysia marginata]|uniref:Phosphoribosyl 1,2-cyclic phosphate phosphodiesterase n=1 Tax=Elysia marginata TaxID=1093978 RepID=A0AAV4FRV6_9GAST|nr:phosphoribosyl 1,2-cyclic phosphate phosphodiesterase [Elysia marginata]